MRFAEPRLARDGDLTAAGALLAAAFPHRAHEPERWRIADGPNATTRWVVDAPTTAPGPFAAYLSLWRVHGRQHRMDLVVAREWRRRGLGAGLVDFLVGRARDADAASLQARTYAEQSGALRLLESRGFRETMRMTGLELADVAAVALPPADEVRQMIERHGLRLTTLAAELAAHPSESHASWQKLRDANQAAQFGWPDPDPTPNGSPPEAETADQFRERSAAVGMIEEACFVAASGDAFVGYSALTLTDEARLQAGSGGTAVRPEYRGLGIATALKASCIRWAAAHDVRCLATSSGNPAMIRVNEKFGFRRTHEEVRTVRRL